MQPSVKPEKIESLKRVAKPAHFTFKIKSFSLLSEVLRKTSNVESYEPPTFEACGHKWKVWFYPNGNKKLGGDEDHISMYLVAADDGIDVAGAEINAMFKFFVMDQLRDEYLAIQDGVVRRFHGLKKEWGFTKLIPLDTFKDETNGYLVDDCCVFGVEILVMAPSQMESACFSLIKAPVNGTFTWKVDKFSALTNSYTRSEPFKVEGSEWILMVAKFAQNGVEYLSLFLKPHNFSSRSKIFVDFDLIVKDQLSGIHKQEFNVNYWFHDAQGYGFARFMEVADVEDKTKGFLVKDTIVVEVNINVISKSA